ncbi:transcriptional activator NhaR [Thalassomonas viridans]|uniref:Transcriptional activator NhaR n=1 Tax=Thalassomonas viridans TaxID=137584 RepID=A0AAE9Z9I4_9GAMM|nr:transcriptional activator NhaR [Thalassomonas viridans]WDE08494.1 transcriptional activator NhaR [Thalassomonas viridans]
MMTRLNYHHLQYFYVIAKSGSIARASEILHITPQTLSMQLNTLENQLGYQLFERRGKKLVLNDIGHITLGYAHEIFNLGDELVNSIKNHSTDFAFSFAIGVTDVIAKVFSFNFLREIYKMDDTIKLVCKETSLEVLLGELATNKLDAVLSDTPLPSNSPIKAYNHLVGKCGITFFASKELAKQLKDDFPQSLNNQHFFIAGEGSNQRMNLLSWFEQKDVTPLIIGEFDDSALAKYFGQAGYGVFCAPSIIENHVVERFNVKILGRTDEIHEDFYLISPERKVKHPAVQHLLNAGKELFKKPMV